MAARTLAIVILIMLTGPMSAPASTWRVELDGSGDYTDIQPAVDAAAPGDTIRIGPGRFDTFRRIGVPGVFDDAIVWVNKPDLMFIGSGIDVTRIGTPSYFGPYAKFPRAFFAMAPNDFGMSDLTVEHVNTSVDAGGNLNATRCLIRLHDPRNRGFEIRGTGSIRNCEFDLAQAASGVSLLGPAHDFEIADCHFYGTSFSASINNGSGGVRNTIIENCVIDNGGVTFGFGATGSIVNCRITSSLYKCLMIIDPGTNVVLRDVELIAAPRPDSAGIEMGSTNLSGTNVSIIGSGLAAIYTVGRCNLSLSNSLLLPASGYAIKAHVASSTPVHVLDLRNNNWGTTDAARIAELIWDHNDDPLNPCTVLFEPFIGQPVRIEKTSWGDLKASFR